MSESIYYCTKENNDCSQRNECERYTDSDAHICKATLFKNACTDLNNRILFIKSENTKEDDLTE